MEEQDSIRLQKKIILVLSIILFLIIVALSEISNDFLADASHLAISEETNQSGDDIETVEQIAYGAQESIELMENTEDGMSDSVNKEEIVTEEVVAKIEEEIDLSEREKRVAKAEVSRHESTRQQIINQANTAEKSANYVSYRSLAESNPPAETEYTKVIEATATAYCLCQKCCGKSPSSPGYGVTASGYKIVPGTGAKVIAVDPKVIPLGSSVYVEGLNGAWDYGHAVAADTGGAIKNIKIDLYMDSHAETLSWGVRKVNVYILGANAAAEETENTVAIETAQEAELVETIENVETVESVEVKESEVMEQLEPMETMEEVEKIDGQE